MPVPAPASSKLGGRGRGGAHAYEPSMQESEGGGWQI